MVETIQIHPKPDPQCPLCEGRGVEGREWAGPRKKGDIGHYEDYITRCPLCYAKFADVYKHASALIERYSGTARQVKNLTAEEIDALWLGDDGKAYRRLLRWLWTPAYEPKDASYGKPDPYAKGKRLPEPKIRTTPYTPKPHRIPEPAPCDKQRTMMCEFDSKALLAALKEAVKIIGHPRYTLPILRCVKLEATEGQLEIKADNLTEIREHKIPAMSMEPGAVALHARRLLDIAKLNPGRMVITAFEDDSAEVLTMTTRYLLHGLPAENFPQRKAA